MHPDEYPKVTRKSLPVSPEELAPLRAKVEAMLKGAVLSTALRGHIDTKAVSIYLRISRRYFNGYPTAWPTLELATVNVLAGNDFDFRQRGICSAVLTMLEEVSERHQRILYVENVLSESLDRHLRAARTGYMRVNGGVGHFSYYRAPSKISILWANYDKAQDIAENALALLPDESAGSS